jgi:hypothetical protein
MLNQMIAVVPCIESSPSLFVNAVECRLSLQQHDTSLFLEIVFSLSPS